jgi:hypothetical protein
MLSLGGGGGGSRHFGGDRASVRGLGNGVETGAA